MSDRNGHKDQAPDLHRSAPGFAPWLAWLRGLIGLVCLVAIVLLTLHTFAGADWRLIGSLFDPVWITALLLLSLAGLLAGWLQFHLSARLCNAPATAAATFDFSIRFAAVSLYLPASSSAATRAVWAKVNFGWTMAQTVMVTGINGLAGLVVALAVLGLAGPARLVQAPAWALAATAVLIGLGLAAAWRWRGVLGALPGAGMVGLVTTAAGLFGIRALRLWGALLLAGAQSGFVESAVLHAAGAVSGLLNVLPGNLGVREAVIVLLAEEAQTRQALAAALLDRLLVIVSTLLAWVVLAAKKRLTGHRRVSA